SRRRHTRSYGDWSSDVCSSDLNLGSRHGSCLPRVTISVGAPARVTVRCGCGRLLVGLTATRHTTGSPLLMPPSMPPWRFVSVPRSEERRVGKEGRSRWGVDG